MPSIARMREPLFGPLQRARQLGVPLRHREAQPAHKERQAHRGQRGVDADDYIDQRVDPRAACGGIGRPEPVLVRGVDADAALAPRHTQQAAVMHGVQQMGRGARRAAPVVLHRAVREMVIHLARVHGAAFAYELQQELCLLLACGGPRPTAFGRDTAIRPRMHQCL